MNRKLIPPEEAAEYLGVTTGTLQTWRSTGKQNLPYVKVGSRVMYPIDGIDSWLDNRTFNHTGES